MTQAATMVLKVGFVKLSTIFRAVFPNVSYRSSNAKRLLFRMPLVAIFINKEQYIMEKIDGFNYISLSNFLASDAIQSSKEVKEFGMRKNDLKDLLSIVKGEKERECIRYAVYKCSTLTQTQARNRFGLENMKARAFAVESSIKEVKKIANELDEIVADQCQALLDCYGLTSPSTLGLPLSPPFLSLLPPSPSSIDDEECSMSDTSESEYDDHLVSNDEEVCSLVPLVDCMPNDDMLMTTLVDSKYNWFEFVEQVERQHYSLDVLVDLLEKFFLTLPYKNLSKEELQFVVQSHRAFNAVACDMAQDDRIVRSINGEVVTDSESELDECTATKDVKSLVVRKQASVKRRARRLKSQILAEKRFLSRKMRNHTSKIIKQFPNIGEIIEEYVIDHNVGADAWRRTGVLTFDGNTNLKNKVTYKKIQAHLKNILSIDISYGTVVELCIPRNKRRRSAKRYRGLAKVTTRRARKGFNLRYNPDAHWSAAFYKGLNTIQYEDGSNVLNINRDDAAGFRLDTLTTCKQHATPVVQGMDVLTTRTDYVNKTPSVLQTTSYNFTRTKTTPEVCVGVVKAAPIHQKNPAQHYSDIQMLEKEPLLKHVFYNCETGNSKIIDCIRVDGASDEGPTHEVVQYFWTDWHFQQEKVVTLVTTRSSGSSYLNRVELQNGCLSLGHANTFIPSTLGGSCIDSQTGKVDEHRLKQNLSLAIDAYISRVDGTPCGETNIKLFEGSDSSGIQSICTSLEIYLKGSKKAKLLLCSQEPQLYARFETIWGIRNRHLVHGLPSSYVFFLRCCFQKECPHPICSRGGSIKDYSWYPNGPPVSTLPLPSIDPERPWGSTSCTDHKGFCTGHYRTIMVDFDNLREMPKDVAMPPSLMLKQIFTTEKDFSQEVIAKENLLSTEEVNIWFDHLNSVNCNRKRGAAKAALTRQQKKNPISVKTTSTETYHCAGCGFKYSESSASFWIACDNCNKWYCCMCEGLSSEPNYTIYFCKKCK